MSLDSYLTTDTIAVIHQVTFVASWAEQYKIPFHERILPPHQRNLVGLQASAREWRRQECFKILSDLKYRKSDKIDRSNFLHTSIDDVPSGGIEKDKNIPKSVVYATAHHADDQHETMLLKLIRGAYITNLQPVCTCSNLQIYTFS